VECWIGVVDEQNRRIVRLAGRLTEAQVPELLATCGDAGRLELDLTDLISVDPAGLDTLQRMQSRGAVLAGVPGYIQLLLASFSRRSNGSTGTPL
jgi:ABC-type transporter Mla MlaB component